MLKNMKVATLSNEIVRRLKCSSTSLNTQTLESIVKNYMRNLEAMGYPLEWRIKVLKSAMVGYIEMK